MIDGTTGFQRNGNGTSGADAPTAGRPRYGSAAYAPADGGVSGDNVDDARGGPGVGSGRAASTARNGIFISYRRSDAQSWAGRLAGDLRQYFGRDRVYRDLDSNRAAADYVRQLEAALAQSRIAIAVIGPHWLSSVDADGQRRLDDPQDLVRLEIERALSGGVFIVPVLVGGATMPALRDVPLSLSTFSRLHGLRLSDEDWSYDFQRLLETLEHHGVLPVVEAPQFGNPDDRSPTARLIDRLFTTRHFERTVQASRGRAYRALVGAVEGLRYPQVLDDTAASQVCFRAGGVLFPRPVVARVVDAGPGRAKVVVRFSSPRVGAWILCALAASFLFPFALLFLCFVVPVAFALHKRFAVGFFDNVERVLGSQPLGPDSARLPGVEQWTRRSREV
jgi:hypothetical protein